MTSSRIAVIAHREKLRPKDGERLRDALGAEGLDVEWIDIPKGRAATKAARRAVERGATHVVVAGGDGTVRATIEALTGGDVPLAVVPAGTANLFAGGLGLPTEPADIARAVRQGTTRIIDTGSCNGNAFAVMAGTGLDAKMIEYADRDKERLGTLAYVRAGIEQARERRPFAARVKVDGEACFDGEATCVLVGNLGTLKGGLEAFPSARPDDGLLDVAIITATGLREWGGLLWNAAVGRPGSSPRAQFHQGSKVTVKMDKDHRYELDGGSRGKDDTLKFVVHPHALHVTVAAA